MDDSTSSSLDQTLSKPDVHNQWEQAFRTPLNEVYYERVFDFLTDYMALPAGAQSLDAGCGVAAHAIRLAKRGLHVTAVDFATYVLEGAAANVAAHGLTGRIQVQQENLLALSFKNDQFDCVLCWGVLMHIGEVETAIAELARVVKPGGYLIITEDNMSSFQGFLRRSLALLNSRKQGKRTVAGIEYWTQTPGGALLTREANISWLISTLACYNLSLQTRRAGQLTTLYTRVKNPILSRLIHSLNALWFQTIKLPQPAFSNVIILRKGAPSSSLEL